MKENVEFEAWMSHPEAVLETYKDMKEEIEHLREQRDHAIGLYSRGCFTQLDNGVEYGVSGYAAGGSPGGVLSNITISWTDDVQGKTWFRKYEPVEDWIEISSTRDEN